MKNNANLTIVSSNLSENDIAWQKVCEALNIIVTLDKVNPKPLNRTGHVMKKALNDLFNAITIYDHMRSKQ